MERQYSDMTVNELIDHALRYSSRISETDAVIELGRRVADAQATVEALQAEKLMLERGVSAQSALIDGLQSQLIKSTADLEAVQHERDEANSHVKFLGATKQANGSFCLDMKKYHARHRCGRHRDDPWKGIDTEIDCFVCLKHALDAERENVAFVEQTAADFQALWRTACDQREVFETQLSQLQALVRALPVIKTAITVYRDAGQFRVQCVEACYWFNTSGEAHAWANLLAYRATLDATSKAGGNK